MERDLREGQHRNPQHRPHWFTTAYFHHPEELRAEVADAGLEVVELVGVEGLAGFLPQLDRRWENAPDRELILWSARVAEAEPSLLGLSAHLLVVARPALYVVEGLGGVTADVSQRGGDVGGPAGRRRHADGEVAQVAIAGSCAGPALEASSHRSRRDCQPPGAWEMEPVRLRSWQPARSAPSTAAMPPGPH